MICATEFCFFCLKKRQECFAAHKGKTYFDVCEAPVKQSLEAIWKIHLTKK